MTTHERISWAVEMLGVQPADMILEIGCGVGIAVAQIAEKAGEQLKKGNFGIVRTVFKALSPVPAFCIIAQPI